MKNAYVTLMIASTALLGLSMTNSIVAQTTLLEAVSQPNAINVTIPVTTASELQKQLNFYKHKYPSGYNNRTLKVTFLFNPKVKNSYTGYELKNIIDTTNNYPNILFLNDINVKMIGGDSHAHVTPAAETLINQINHLPLTAESPTITFEGNEHFTAYDVMAIIMSLARTPVVNIITPQLSGNKVISQTMKQTGSQLTTAMTLVDVKAAGSAPSLSQCQQFMTSYVTTTINGKSTDKITVSPTHFITDMNMTSQLIIANNGVMNQMQGTSHLLINNTWQTVPSYLTLYQAAMSNEVYGFLTNKYCTASVHGNIKPKVGS